MSDELTVTFTGEAASHLRFTAGVFSVDPAEVVARALAAMLATEPSRSRPDRNSVTIYSGYEGHPVAGLYLPAWSETKPSTRVHVGVAYTALTRHIADQRPRPVPGAAGRAQPVHRLVQVRDFGHAFDLFRVMRGCSVGHGPLRCNSWSMTPGGSGLAGVNPIVFDTPYVSGGVQ